MSLAAATAAAPVLSATFPSGSEWIGIAASYLLGAVPFSWLLARAIKGVDLREIGSGNIGATNAARALGRPLGILAFALDFGKGWASAGLIAPAFDARGRGMAVGVLCGAAAVLGHVWPIYLGFKGGKAVATGCGLVVAVDPLVFAVGGATWLAALFGFGYAGLASMLMCAAFPLAAAWRVSSGAAAFGWDAVAWLGALAVLVILRHKKNIERMLAGTEPRRGALFARRGSHVRG
jgi:glycerol-3-phosphate acyltransferase PlsY